MPLKPTIYLHFILTLARLMSVSGFSVSPVLLQALTQYGGYIATTIGIENQITPAVFFPPLKNAQCSFNYLTATASDLPTVGERAAIIALLFSTGGGMTKVNSFESNSTMGALIAVVMAYFSTVRGNGTNTPFICPISKNRLFFTRKMNLQINILIAILICVALGVLSISVRYLKKISRWYKKLLIKAYRTGQNFIFTDRIQILKPKKGLIRLKKISGVIELKVNNCFYYFITYPTNNTSENNLNYCYIKWFFWHFNILIIFNTLLINFIFINLVLDSTLFCML